MRWIALACLVGCATAPDPDPAHLQMNDLAILLPLPRAQAELDAMLAPATQGRGGALVPLDTFQATTPFETYERFRAVAIRIDPCFGAVGDAACRPQIRLVFQPVAIGTAEDVGMHALYSLTSEELTALVGEITDARRADGATEDLGPLAPHPIIAREGLDGALAQAFDRIVTKYAGAENLIRINTFAISELDVSQGFVSLLAWNFTSADTAPAAARPIPAIEGSLAEMTLTAALAPLVITDDPVATTADQIAGNHGFDAALRIENPHVHSPETVDCASCHMAQPQIELAGLDGGRDSAFVASSGIPSADLASTTHLINPDRGLNIHAFSYRLTEPMINQRTINETAANVAYLAGQ